MSFIQQNTNSLLDQKERILEGWMKKKSPRGIVKVWQSRFFVLYEDVLQYFKKKNDLNPAGMIPLQSITEIDHHRDKKKGCRFDVIVGEAGDNQRVFGLLTDTDADADLWVKKLRELVSMYDTGDAAQELNIDTRGKFWKNTTQIRQARAASVVSWGDRPYLLDNENESKTPSELSVFEDEKDTDGVPFTIVKKLADVCFGQIFKVKEKKTGALYLMHVYLKDSGDVATAERLIQQMGDVDHPFVFQQVFRGSTTDTLFGIYSFALGQNLFVHLREHRRFPEEVARFFAAEVISGITYLHSKGIKFFNMGPENIFLDEDGHIAVSDFLLALPDDRIPEESHTKEYRTPEFLINNGKVDTIKSDWWRLGVLLYELMVGIPPFRSKDADPDELNHKIMNHTAETLRFPPFISQEGINLIQALLNVDPNARLGGGEEDGHEVMRHPWFSVINWNALKNRQVDPPDFVYETLSDYRNESEMNVTNKEYKVVVRVLEARGLPGLNHSGLTSDAYCRVEYGTTSFTTKVVRDSLAPAFNEEYEFTVPMTAEGKLDIHVFHKDESRMSDPVIGVCSVTMNEIKQAKHLEFWSSIIGQDFIAHGELFLHLKWTQKLGRKLIGAGFRNWDINFAKVFSLSKNSRRSVIKSIGGSMGHPDYEDDDEYHAPPPSGAPPSPPM